MKKRKELLNKRKKISNEQEDLLRKKIKEFKIKLEKEIEYKEPLLEEIKELEYKNNIHNLNHEYYENNDDDEDDEDD